MAFTIKQSDTSPSIRAVLQSATGPIDLTSAAVRFHMKSIEGTLVVDQPMTIVSPATSGTVSYDWQTADTDTAGTYFAEFEVTYADTSVETFPNSENIPIVITPELN